MDAQKWAAGLGDFDEEPPCPGERFAGARGLISTSLPDLRRAPFDPFRQIAQIVLGKMGSSCLSHSYLIWRGLSGKPTAADLWPAQKAASQWPEAP